MSKEIVRIEMCPHCRGAHAYQLEVERANIIKVLRTHKKGEKPSRVKVCPHFVCPVRNEQYQVSFYLQDTSSDRIRAVSVIGLVEGTE
jgi:Zn-finger nucleic acid-binding protein